MWVQLQDLVLDILVKIICGLISVAAIYVIAWIAKLRKLAIEKTQSIKDENARKFAQDALCKLQTVTETVVREIEQTTAAALREAVKEGIEDRQKLLDLGNQAVTEIKDILSASVIEYLRTFTDDLDSFIKALVEGAVLKIKHEQPASLVPFLAELNQIDGDVQG